MGKISLIASGSFGIGAVAAGIGGFYAVYNTPSISNVVGISMEVGGSVPVPGGSLLIAGLSFGVDKSYAISCDSFDGIVYSLGAGIGLPVEAHFQITSTVNVSDGLAILLRIILGSLNNQADSVIHGDLKEV